MNRSNPAPLLGPSHAAGGLLAELERQFALRDEGRGAGRRIYLDTPERRLTARGERLWVGRQGEALHLFHRLRGARVPRRSAAERLPQRVGELPSELRRGALRGAAEEDPLEVLAVVDWRLRFAALEDGAGEEALVVEERRARSVGRSKRLPSVFVLRPGAGAELVRRVEVVASAHGYRPLAEDELEAALRGATPAIDRRAAAARPAGRAVLDALREERAALRRTLPAALDQRDAEALHQMRIALRRTRALLANFRAVLPPRTGARFARDFGWFQSVTGRARDLDVLRLQVAARGEAASALLASIDAARDEAHAQLAALARGRRAQRFFDRWDALLARAPERLSPAARLPLGPLVAERLRRRARKLRRTLRALPADAAPRALHDVRIAAKKLRYALEPFQELCRRKPLERLLRALRSVQEELGARNDAAVQAELLRDLAGPEDGSAEAERCRAACEALARRGLEPRLARRLRRLARALRARRVARLLRAGEG